MDVRCEKCQTEYELDEARLKPGGVTVKCTNCGHMFKIRKRAITNVGAPPAAEQRPRTSSSKPPGGSLPRADSILSDEAPTTRTTPDEGPTSVERQWVIRLENGEQKSCRELATLQQWIVACVVSRESLISRTGKTWKRLGDIAELAQYFDIADEARTTRADRTTKQTGKPAAASTMLGVGAGPAAAGGTILPDDDEELGRTTGNFRAHPAGRPPTQPPPVPGTVPTRTPPQGSAPARRPLTTPPPPPAKKSPSQSGPLPDPTAIPAVPSRSGVPDQRSTAAWASEPVNPHGVTHSAPFGGKISAIPDEPAFAGRVRVAPSDESSFETGRVTAIDDDDDMLPRRSGSRAGILILVMTLLVGGAAAAIVYLFVIKKDPGAEVATAPADAQAAPVADGQIVITPVIDAGELATPSPFEAAHAELATDNEARLRTAYEALAGNDDPEALAVRANLGTAIAQALSDRAGLVPSQADASKLRKEAKTIVIAAATAAQKAYKARPDDAAANLAMAAVLRLQGKPARDFKRYADTAKAKATPAWERDVAVAAALVLARDGELEDADAAFAAIDRGDGKLETSNDVRARFHRALIALAQKRTDEAKTLVDQVLAAQPEHAAARALAARLETAVATTDPLPPEDTGSGPGPGPGPRPDVISGGSYDQLLARANSTAESNCTRAIDIYMKALEQKPNGVEALSGMGYCHIDAKQFASAFSKFRAALAVSSKYEPALWGIAEAYQQQGLKERAIESYRKYLEIYPGTAKAKKQLERLGAGEGAASGTDAPPAGSGATPTPPAPTPAPAPAPAAPTEATGSGSG